MIKEAPLLFILPDPHGVHERMEFDWMKRSGHVPAAICHEKDAEELAAFFNPVYTIEAHAPSRARLIWALSAFTAHNLLTFRSMGFNHWRRALGYLKVQMQLALAIERCAKMHRHDRFYSFWAFDPVRNQMLGERGNKFKSITRAHGGDIYQHSDYIGQPHIWPWRTNALQTYDAILSVSKEGTDYLKQTHHLLNAHTVYLGSRTPPFDIASSTEGKNFILVSVSNIIPLKRIDRIASIIRRIDAPIEWHHFGAARDSGYEQRLKTEVQQMLDSTPHKVTWHGQSTIAEIFAFYKQSLPSLFISCSESEGIPVSIMEAMSCCIPVLTTDAGGSRELIRGNGKCVSVDINEADAAEWIASTAMNPSKRQSMREASRGLWVERFSFERNQKMMRDWIDF